MKFIQKRKGNSEKFEISKVEKCTKAACEGLYNVSSNELIKSAQHALQSALDTKQIQQILIQTAVDKIDIDTPNWSFVAARLFLFDLYHQVNGNKGYPSLVEYLTLGIENGRIASGFIEKFDLNLLNESIEPLRDFQFSYLGIRTLYDRYLLKNKNNEPIELPQHMFMAIAMYLAQNEADCNRYAIEFYNVLSKFEFMVATPTLSNARTPHPQLSSCYVGSTDDNLEDIFDCYKDMALLSKYGGGIGWDFTKVRALGSNIANHPNAAGGIIPFLRIANDVAIAVNQLGTRKGAIAIYIEIWHQEVIEFLDLRKNSGDERRRTHDLFTALWVCDLFMKRLMNNESWTLFDPLDCIDLTDCYGELFETKYIQYESKLIKNGRAIQIPAKELWKRVLTSCFETGLPFVCFKDNANYTNPNKHAGLIRSSNLCTEIFQNTNPSKYSNKERLTGQVAVCNLGSINLSKVNTDEDIKRVVSVAVRMLDNVIDLNMYPIDSARITNLQTRSIGLGVMGEAEMLATKRIHWGSANHVECINRIMESISYYTILTSSELANERGSYPLYKGSTWSEGLFPFDFYKERGWLLNDLEKNHDWGALRFNIKNRGMRNGYLMAIAPTSSISILTNTTQTIEPIYKTKWYEENLSGLIPVIAPNLSIDTIEYYKSAYSIDMNRLVELASVRQKWIDQGQSMNLFIPIEKANGRYINDIYTKAWELGLKSIYYLRTESVKTDVMDRTLECYNCQ